MQRSKIFMSFSHFEGLGLPPIEAALSGNHVVGYSGQGGKEFWSPAVFDAVESGDVVGFAQRVLHKIHQLDEAPEFPLALDVIEALRARYSPAQEKNDMRTFIRTMGLTA